MKIKVGTKLALNSTELTVISIEPTGKGGTVSVYCAPYGKFYWESISDKPTVYPQAFPRVYLQGRGWARLKE